MQTQAQARYNKKMKSITFRTNIENHAKIKALTEKKGYTSLNDYLKRLVEKDLNIKL